MGGWRRLQNEFHSLSISPNVIRVMRQVEHKACMGEMRNAYNILFGKHDRKRLLGRPRNRWEDIIRMDLRDIGWEGMD
jgi:hypothetical protein